MMRELVEKTIDINGIKMFYRMTGEGPPLIALHGNGEDGMLFAGLAEKLADRFTVYLLDARGHGGSVYEGPLSYEQMADDLETFINALSLSAPVVIGFSDGAIVGLKAAIQRPDIFSKLILCGANLSLKACRLTFRIWLKAMTLMQNSPHIELMRDQADIPPESLSVVPCPVLVLCGTKDIVPKKHSRLIADSLPNGTLSVLKGENHFSYIIDSNKLYTHIQEFLR